MPQSVTVVTQELIRDQLMTSIGDVVRYVPGITAHQGENNRDQIIIRGNSSSADFFVNGVRDDVQYYRDLYNVDRVEALKGPNAMIFGRGGAGGVVNRVMKQAGFQPVREVSLQGGMYGNRRFSADIDQPLSDKVAFRLNGMFEDSDSFRDGVGLKRYGVTPTLTIAPSSQNDDHAALRTPARHARRGSRHSVVSGLAGRCRSGDLLRQSRRQRRAGGRRSRVGDDRASRWRASRFAITRCSATTIGSIRTSCPERSRPISGQVSLSVYNNDTARRNLFNQTDLTYVTSTGSAPSHASWPAPSSAGS